MRLALQSVGSLQGLLMRILSHLGQYRNGSIVFHKAGMNGGSRE